MWIARLKTHFATVCFLFSTRWGGATFLFTRKSLPTKLFTFADDGLFEKKKKKERKKERKKKKRNACCEKIQTNAPAVKVNTNTNDKGRGVKTTNTLSNLWWYLRFGIIFFLYHSNIAHSNRFCAYQRFFPSTKVQNNQESRRKYWATRSSVRWLARTALSFACSALLALLAHSAALTRSLAHSFRSPPRSWGSEWLGGYFFCFFPIGPLRPPRSIKAPCHECEHVIGEPISLFFINISAC